MSFDENLEFFGTRPALIDEWGTLLTYADLVTQCSHLEQKLGKEKKLILILCKNNAETLIGYLASLRGHHTAILIDATSSDKFIATLIEQYQPDYLWQEHEGSYQLLPCQPAKLRPRLHEQLALLLTTSGSTGSPKLVRLSKNNLHANAQSISNYLKLSAKERPITTLPLHYSYGLSVINSHLLVGACILLTQASVAQKEFWDFFKQHSATSLAGVPYTYEMLLKFRLLQLPLPSLTYLTQAGGGLQPQTRQALISIAEQKKIKLFIMYGQTEATARIAYLPFEMLSNKKNSIGIAIPQGTLTLMDSEKKLITQAHCEGEIIYQGSNVMMGYANNIEDLAQADLLQGTLHTGDLGYFDEEGYFYITGRLKRFLKLYGNRFNLADIENQLNTQNFACACCGVDDHLFIATTTADAKESIKHYVIEQYKLHHSSVTVHELTTFPYNSQGKILYHKLLELMRETHD